MGSLSDKLLKKQSSYLSCASIEKLLSDKIDNNKLFYPIWVFEKGTNFRIRSLETGILSEMDF